MAMIKKSNSFLCQEVSINFRKHILSFQWALNMNKYIFLLVFFLSGCSMLSFADGSINYGYDKSNNLIYAKKDGKKRC
jgi:hypothetical protein